MSAHNIYTLCTYMASMMIINWQLFDQPVLRVGVSSIEIQSESRNQNSRVGFSIPHTM